MKWVLCAAGALALAIGGVGWLVLELAPFELGGTRRLSGSDCKPRKLTRVDDCLGVDESWQECRFYFRASGTPDRAFCDALGVQASPPGAPLRSCDFSNPGAWTALPCEDYGFPSNLSCFGCKRSEHEAYQTYVYAYDSACTHGIEQVTCNFDPRKVGGAIADMQ